MSTTIEKHVLLKAKELIGDRKRWTTGCEARAGNGRSVDFASPKARRFCAMGALQKCAMEMVGDEDVALRMASDICDRLSASFIEGGEEIWVVNDCVGREAVLEIFDKAIVAA